jgi:pSer/pThr/pTyr-binding forkhead associated (FHA) protein
MTDASKDWELHLAGRPHSVGDGVTIGRASECEIVLADGSVSRQHARVRPVGAKLVLDDLGSRHGVRVNGEQVRDTVELVHGDRIGISEHTFVVFDRGRARRDQMPTVDAVPQRVPRVARTVRTLAVTGEVDPVAAALNDAEDALARSDVAILTRGIDAIAQVAMERERTGGFDPDLLRRFASCVSRAAVQCGRPEWLDGLLELHMVRSLPMHPSTLEAFEVALQGFPGYDRRKMATYVVGLRAHESKLGGRDRATLARLSHLAIGGG